MALKNLKYQSKLTVVELDQFMSQFLNIFMYPIDEPTVEDREKLLEDIYLGDKATFLKEILEAYRKNIKREKKMSQSESLTELNNLRKKLMSGHLAYIATFETDCNEEKSAAAISYRRLTEQYKYFGKLTNIAKSSVIRKYVDALQSEEYAEAFKTLELEERTLELQEVNERYISLSEERDNAEKSISDSPTVLRQQCINAYRDLVSLINFALQKNKYYIYNEKAISLAALTERTQELINRRRHAAESEEEIPEDTIDNLPEESTDEVA